MSDTPQDTTADITGDAEETPAELHGCPLIESRGQDVLHVPRERWVEVVKLLADDGYAMCVDLTGVDYSRFMNRELPAGVTPERFEVVANLLDMANRRRIRLRTQVPEDDPRVDSLFDVHPGTEAMERETFDMFGVTFDGHPDPSRILMPEDWDGHPLRKDYGTGAIPVQFKGAPA